MFRVVSRNNPAPEKTKQSAVLNCIGALPGSICRIGRQCSNQQAMTRRPNDATATPAYRGYFPSNDAPAGILASGCVGMLVWKWLLGPILVNWDGEPQWVFNPSNRE